MRVFSSIAVYYVYIAITVSLTNYASIVIKSNCYFIRKITCFFKAFIYLLLEYNDETFHLCKITGLILFLIVIEHNGRVRVDWLMIY